MKKNLLLLLGVGIVLHAQAQEAVIPTKKQGLLYISWGYHRDGYTNSTIHFWDHKTNDYDFTFHDAKAKDQPDMSKLLTTGLTIPQFSASIGYIFPNKNGWGVELSTDHLKYVVIDNQVMHMTGEIHGAEYNKDTLVTENFVHYEHTNGNNYHMINVVKRTELLRSKNGNHVLATVFKAGAGILLPKTMSIIMGQTNDGPYRVAGFVVGVSANLRYEFFKYVFIEASLKGCYADFTRAKLVDEGEAAQHFYSIQYMGSIGTTIPIGGK